MSDDEERIDVETDDIHERNSQLSPGLVRLYRSTELVHSHTRQQHRGSLL